jgi:hypothetical protein
LLELLWPDNRHRLGLVPYSAIDAAEPSNDSRRISRQMALTPEIFIEAFRARHGWSCKPGTAIANDLTAFAVQHTGSTLTVDELYSIFCLSNGLAPYPVRKRTGKSGQ